MYYDNSKLLSRNSLINFVIGERGCGKSYAFKKFLTNRCIKNNEEFVYLRRYKTELKTSVPHFFDDLIANNEFPDVKLKVDKGMFYADKKLLGYSIALSTANILKSTSFAKVKYILFDEFIIDKGTYKYLANEVEQFLDLVETIARLRDIKVYMLANAISITNPYFTYFNISLPYNNTFATFKDGLITLEYIKNEEYRQKKKESKFGKLIDGTDYGKYAIDNEFLRDKKSFIGKKPDDVKTLLTLVLDDTYYGLWFSSKTGLLYFSLDYDPNNPYKFTTSVDSHSEDTKLINSKSNPYIKMIIDKYKDGLVGFESQKIKNTIMQELSKFTRY